MRIALKIFLAIGVLVAMTPAFTTGSQAATIDCYGSYYSYRTTCYTYDYSQTYNELLRLQLLQLQLKADIVKIDQEQRLEAEKQAKESLQKRYDRAEQTFTVVYKEIFAKDPTTEDQDYWIGRILNDGLNDGAVREKMLFYKSIGKTRGETSVSKVSGVNTLSLAPKINSLFRSIYGRNPSPSENTYWISRIADKPTEKAMKDAMEFHKVTGINH